MYRPWSNIWLASACATSVLADFVGPIYPVPQDLTSDKSLVSAAWENVTSTIETYLNDSVTNATGLSGLKNLTFSLGMFSIHDHSAADSLQFHYTSAEVANSTTGATKVDGNTLYRLASVTKLITALAGMIELDDQDWNRPITEFVPSFAAYDRNRSGPTDPVNDIQWNQVTLAALAAHMAGTPRDVIPYDGSDVLYTVPDPVGTFGLPPLNPTDPLALPPCARSPNETCTGNEYAKGAQARPPVFLPWTSPSYTDFGYMLLGIAIANISGKSIHDVYRADIFTPLNMTSSRSVALDESEWKNLVIPGNITNAALTLDFDLEVTIPSGGLFSTTNDLAKLGTAILNSSLLPADQTRKWMKQVSHTGGLQFSIGRPWEIYRYVHPTSGHVTDIYTKSGNSGAYGGYLVVIPDFDVGFSILGASSLAERAVVTPLLADLLTDGMLPALMAQAESEAERTFAGVYSSTDASLNSSLTLAVNHTQGAAPGLVITSFISNGTDVLLAQALGFTTPIRLVPTIPSPPTTAGLRHIAFRTSAAQIPSMGLFSRQFTTDTDWVTGDSGTYGGIGLGLFVFGLDEERGVRGGGVKAVSVRPAGWRVELERRV